MQITFNEFISRIRIGDVFKIINSDYPNSKFKRGGVGVDVDERSRFAQVDGYGVRDGAVWRLDLISRRKGKVVLHAIESDAEIESWSKGVLYRITPPGGHTITLVHIRCGSGRCIPHKVMAANSAPTTTGGKMPAPAPAVKPLLDQTWTIKNGQVIENPKGKLPMGRSYTNKNTALADARVVCDTALRYKARSLVAFEQHKDMHFEWVQRGHPSMYMFSVENGRPGMVCSSLPVWDEHWRYFFSRDEAEKARAAAVEQARKDAPYTLDELKALPPDTIVYGPNVTTPTAVAVPAYSAVNGCNVAVPGTQVYCRNAEAAEAARQRRITALQAWAADEHKRAGV